MSGERTGSGRRLSELEAEARYARERFDLYRARSYGPRATSAARLRELERRSRQAQERLERELEADSGREEGAGGLVAENARQP